MKKPLAAILLTMLIGPVFADTDGLTRSLERSQTEYCTVDDVQVIKTLGSNDEKGYVFYSTRDILENGTCFAGGSGTGVFHIAQVTNPYAAGLGIRVENPDILSNFAQKINTRFIDVNSIRISDNGILKFINNEFGVDPVTGREDANCCAADRYLNTIRLFDLKLMSRERLGRDHSYSQ